MNNVIITMISFMLRNIAKENINSRLRTKLNSLMWGEQNKTCASKYTKVSIYQRDKIKILIGETLKRTIVSMRLTR